jgi:predicted N-acyltransferase
VLEHGERVLGAMPGYLKLHSYGEFVFDWGWAEAYERAGLEYYPKLLSAVPFTPATGPRLLAAPGADPQLLARGMVSAAMQLCEQGRMSSAHWLFPHAANVEQLRELPLLERWGCQYHWHNDGFRDFQDYLDALTSKRRKQVRKERREAAASGLELVRLHGGELREHDIAAYHALYCSTYDRKWGYPSLSLEFFLDLAQTMPNSLLMVLARRGRKVIAGAHLLRGDTALFGRNWGCCEQHRSLHFEICYYQGIEYAIEAALARFEAGAQGEHKITRGFLPVKTHSFHFLRDARLRSAVDAFLRRERVSIEHHIAAMADHSPFNALTGVAPAPAGDIR